MDRPRIACDPLLGRDSIFFDEEDERERDELDDMDDADFEAWLLDKE